MEGNKIDVGTIIAYINAEESMDTLREINNAIRRKWNILKEGKIARAFLNFKIGDKVRFRVKGYGGPIIKTGRIVKAYKKHFRVQEEDGCYWKVNAIGLTKVE